MKKYHEIRLKPEVSPALSLVNFKAVTRLVVASNSTASTKHSLFWILDTFYVAALIC